MSVNQDNNNSESSEVISNDNTNEFNTNNVETSSTEEEPIDYNIDDVEESKEIEKNTNEPVEDYLTEVKQETESPKEIISEIIEEVVEIITETIEQVENLDNSPNEIENTKHDVEELYVITVNDIPYFYEKDLEKAQEDLKRIGEIYTDLNSLTMEYDEEEGELNVVEKTNFLFFTITTEKYNLKIHKVKSLD